MKKMKKLADFPEWQEAEKRLIEIQQQITATDQEYQQQLFGITTQRQQRWTERLEQEALGVLDGTPPPATIEETKLLNLERKLKVLRRAETIHRQRMVELRSELSKTIAQQVQPEYATLVREMAQQTIKLAKLIEREQQFREALIDGDISFTSVFQPCFLRGVGTTKDEHSRVNVFLREALRDGFLTHNEIEVLQ